MESFIVGRVRPRVTIEGGSTSSDTSEPNKHFVCAAPSEVKPPAVGCASTLSHLSYGCPGFTDRDARMKITPQTFGTVLSNMQIVIPLFQRRYCWTEKQGANWWLDVRNPTKRGGWNSSHNTGKIVVMKHGSGSVYQMVCIDGQQRLTTTTLLVAAIRDAAMAIAPSGAAALVALLSRVNKLLHVGNADGERTHSSLRLQPSYIDRASFFSILGHSTHQPQSTQTSVNPFMVSMKSLFDLRVAEVLRGCASCDEMTNALN